MRDEAVNVQQTLRYQYNVLHKFQLESVCMQDTFARATHSA